jgi:hypothetical protein
MGSRYSQVGSTTGRRDGSAAGRLREGSALMTGSEIDVVMEVLSALEGADVDGTYVFS